MPPEVRLEGTSLEVAREERRRRRLNLDWDGVTPDRGTPSSLLEPVDYEGSDRPSPPGTEQGPPPNHRQAIDDTEGRRKRCAHCTYFDGGTLCTLYNWTTRPDLVSDSFESSRDEEGGGHLRLSDDDDRRNGAMVALYPPQEVVDHLKSLGGDVDPSEYHVTLAFLGDQEDVVYRESLGQLVEELAMRTPPIDASISGIGHFVTGDRCSYASVDSPLMGWVRGRLVQDLQYKGTPARMEHGFTPHITLQYGERLDAEPAPLEFTFDSISLVIGDERRDIPFNSDAEETTGLYLADEVEVFMAGAEGAAAVEEDGLLWKESLREGQFIPVALPDAEGRVKVVDMRVIDGHSPDPSVAIGLDDILEAHNDRLYDHVTVPLSHKDRPHENTGFVDKLRKTTRDGMAVLQSGVRFTKDAIKESVIDGSIANVSSGLRFFQQHHETKKVYPVSMAHLALTNKPWVPGMRPFGTDLADDACVLSLQLADEQNPEGGDELDPQNGGGTATATPPEGQSEVEKLRLDLEREREQNAGLRESLARTQATVHRGEVDKEALALQESGLPPGFCKEARALMLEDDGGPVLKLDLSDEGGEKDTEISVTGIVKRLAGTLLGEDGKYKQASDELHLSDEQRPPPDDGGAGGQKTVSERADAIEQELGGGAPASTSTSGGGES